MLVFTWFIVLCLSSYNLDLKTVSLDDLLPGLVAIIPFICSWN